MVQLAPQRGLGLGFACYLVERMFFLFFLTVQADYFSVEFAADTN
jgi:hypothetical protein